MLSVLQVTPALDAGGVERTTIEIAEAITKAGGIAVVASRGGRLEPDLKAAGGELALLPMDTKNPITMWLNARRLAKLAKSRGVALIHARSRAPAWSALWAARQLGIPFVTTYHGVYNAKSGLKRFYNSVMARGDVVIANSEFTRAHVIKEHHADPGSVVAIPRGADFNRFSPDKISLERLEAVRGLFGLSRNDTRFVVLLPARLTRWKGQGVLIEAAYLVLREMPNSCVFVLAGDSQGRESYAMELVDLARGRGISENVRIPGHVHDIPAALAAADIAVFPSTDPEAFGRGAVEAQAMGVPVVVAAHGGLRETVEDGVTGIYVPPSDPAALAAAIIKLIEAGPDARRAMGANGRKRALSRYSVEALKNATLNVYRRLMDAAGSKGRPR
jgi:glycosyltransferase involved in cell wall biosynthesis